MKFENLFYLSFLEGWVEVWRDYSQIPGTSGGYFIFFGGGWHQRRGWGPVLPFKPHKGRRHSNPTYLLLTCLAHVMGVFCLPGLFGWIYPSQRNERVSPLVAVWLMKSGRLPCLLHWGQVWVVGASKLWKCWQFDVSVNVLERFSGKCTLSNGFSSWEMGQTLISWQHICFCIFIVKI